MSRRLEILPKDTKLSSSYDILSQRELEVLILVAAGVSNQQISEIFQVTLSAIKRHLEHIYEKLNAKNRVNAVFIAQQIGLINLYNFNLVINSPNVQKVVKIIK